MIDFKFIQKDDSGEYLSKVAQVEFDCANESRRLLALHYYSENMQGGNIVFSYIYQPGESMISPITPNSLGEKDFKAACGKK